MLESKNLTIELLSGNALQVEILFNSETNSVERKLWGIPFEVQESGSEIAIVLPSTRHTDFAPIIKEYWGVKIPVGQEARLPITPETKKQIEDFEADLRGLE